MKSYAASEKILKKRRLSGIQLGLDRFSILLKKLGNPQDKFRTIHVAGTNGKGSVCAMAEAVLRAAGYKTGLYTSPHLFEYRERIRINSKTISRADFAKYFFRAYQAAEKIEKISAAKKLAGAVSFTKIIFTEFELLTAAAFLALAGKKTQIAVIETGLGGRLDATNVLNPLVSVITRIGLDHREFLGNTLKKIAAEKAGIIKAGIPVVTLPDKKVWPVIKKTAGTRQAPLIFPGSAGEKPAKKYFRSLSLDGEFQKENLSLVLKTLETLKNIGFKIPETAVIRGLKNVRWPGRFQTIHKNPTMIVDGGHNPQAARALASSLRREFPGQKISFVAGILRRKDYRGILGNLAPVAGRFFIIGNFDENSWSIAEIGKYLNKINKPAAEFFSSKFKKNLLANKNEIFCFTGSLKTAALGLHLLHLGV